MKKILLDVSVILDVLLDREPHAKASSAVWELVESGAVEGLLAAHGVTTIHYLVRKELGNGAAARTVKMLLGVFGVAPVNAAGLIEALQSSVSDFEDSVGAVAARHSSCDYIITRDPKGFRASPVPVLTPETAVPLLRPH